MVSSEDYYRDFLYDITSPSALRPTHLTRTNLGFQPPIPYRDVFNDSESISSSHAIPGNLEITNKLDGIRPTGIVAMLGEEFNGIIWHRDRLSRLYSARHSRYFRGNQNGGRKLTASEWALHFVLSLDEQVRVRSTNEVEIITKAMNYLVSSNTLGYLVGYVSSI